MEGRVIQNQTAAESTAGIFQSNKVMRTTTLFRAPASNQIKTMFPRITFLLCTIFISVSWSANSSAELKSLLAKQWGEQGTYSAGRYIWVNADMYGSVNREDGSIGNYRVPVTLIYAETAPARVGLVDLINSASYQLMRAGIQPIPKNYVTAHGQKLLSDYIWRSGLSYIAVQWAKMVTDVRGHEYGVIENGEDGYEIIADAAGLLKTPVTIQGDVPFQLPAVKQTISFGYSQPAFLQWGLFNAGKNRRQNGSLIFDGMLAVTGGLTDKCRLLNNDSTPRSSPYFPTHPVFYSEVPCHRGVPDDGKFIKLETETEVMFNAAHTRYEVDNFRQYEIAGVSHVTPKLMNLGRIGQKDQNYVSTNEIIKAAFQLLVDWIRDRKDPPANIYIEGNLNADGTFTVARDKDGNALGGIRPPHMISHLQDGTEVGAPLGKYVGRRPAPGPINEQPVETSFFWYWLPIIGGQFTAFDNSRLRELYPSREVYRERVERAADALKASGFLLQEDHRSIVMNAQYWDYSNR